VLKSGRLRLEPIARQHAALLYDGLQDPALYPYLAADPPADVAELAARYDFLAGRTSPDGTEAWLNWVLFERAGSTALGYIQATLRGDAAFLGYVLLTAAQRRGTCGRLSRRCSASSAGAGSPQSLRTSTRATRVRSRS